MADADNRKIAINVLFDRDLLDRLDKHIKECPDRLSRSEVIRRAVNQFLTR